MPLRTREAGKRREASGELRTGLPRGSRQTSNSSTRALRRGQQPPQGSSCPLGAEMRNHQNRIVTSPPRERLPSGLAGGHPPRMGTARLFSKWRNGGESNRAGVFSCSASCLRPSNHPRPDESWSPILGGGGSQSQKQIPPGTSSRNFQLDPGSGRPVTSLALSHKVRTRDPEGRRLCGAGVGGLCTWEGGKEGRAERAG